MLDPHDLVRFVDAVDDAIGAAARGPVAGELSLQGLAHLPRSVEGDRMWELINAHALLTDLLCPNTSARFGSARSHPGLP